MGLSILVIGGARSGKSKYALNLCNKIDKKKYIFLATAQALDKEMEKKIKKHKNERGSKWITIEEPVNIVDRIKEEDNINTIILLDCITLWINNLFMKRKYTIEKEISNLLKVISKIKGDIVIVSNEVGMGIVPNNQLTRKYRDILGYANQHLAYCVNRVVFMVAGIPIIIKSDFPSKYSLIS